MFTNSKILQSEECIVLFIAFMKSLIELLFHGNKSLFSGFLIFLLCAADSRLFYFAALDFNENFNLKCLLKRTQKSKKNKS